MKNLSLKQLETLVKEKYSLIKALKKLNPDQFYQIGHTCFCPFHDNTNTPAASIYSGKHGETLYCFSEQKLYTVNDVFSKLMRYDIFEIGRHLWKSMSSEEQYNWLQDHGESDFSETFSKPEQIEFSKETKKAIALFKNNKMSFELLIDKLLEEA